MRESFVLVYVWDENYSMFEAADKTIEDCRSRRRQKCYFKKGSARWLRAIAPLLNKRRHVTVMTTQFVLFGKSHILRN